MSLMPPRIGARRVERTKVGRQREMEVVSNFKRLMASEFEAIRSEAPEIHVNVSIPEFSYATQSECWTNSITSEITSFTTALKTCQQTLSDNNDHV